MRLAPDQFMAMTKRRRSEHMISARRRLMTLHEVSSFFFFVVFFFCVAAAYPAAPEGGVGAPAMFVFGDSLVDSGNNNYILSPVRANFKPYGIDVGTPTGRFCNGLTVVDFGASYLGLPYPPPYLKLAAEAGDILKGVNYASGAAGILDTTGINFGARITFNGQIELFEKTARLQLPVLMPHAAERSAFLARSIFVVNIGSNDYINDYLHRNISVHNVDLLLSTLSGQLTKLYHLGARKMVVAGIGPLGCMPSQIARSAAAGDDGRCVNGVNDVVLDFNRLLLPLVLTLNASLPGSFFVYQDTYGAVADIIAGDHRWLKVVNVACCGGGWRYHGEVTCLPQQRPCSARDEFVFWDPFHPTQAANAIIAAGCYTAGAGAGYCYPISVYELATNI